MEVTAEQTVISVALTQAGSTPTLHTRGLLCFEQWNGAAISFMDVPKRTGSVSSVMQLHVVIESLKAKTETENAWRLN